MRSAKDDVWFNMKFWPAYFVYEWLANASVDDEFYRYLVNASVIVPITLLASLFTVHVLFKRFYLKDKKRLFWIGLIISMFFFILARRLFNYYYTYPLYFPAGFASQPLFFLPKLIIEGVGIYLIAGVYLMFYLGRAWYEQQRLMHILQQKKAEAELQLLKSQIHPHFIFNTLNNIYSYAIQKNDRTPDLIHRLSSFLSYNLYDSKSNYIELTKELEYIRSYIELEKVRYGDRLDVSLNLFNPIEGFLISPLLLLPLVENSFKHGATSALSKCWIRMDIFKQNDWLTVKLENSVNDRPQRNGSSKNGLGIENVKKRLEIIYPDKHELKSMNEEHSFLTILKIKNLAIEN